MQKECVDRKWSELWKNSFRIIHEDNAPGHDALPVKQIWPTNESRLLKDLSYLPNPALYDFPLFPEVKSLIKKIILELVDAVKDKTTAGSMSRLRLTARTKCKVFLPSNLDRRRDYKSQSPSLIYLHHQNCLHLPSNGKDFVVAPEHFIGVSDVMVESNCRKYLGSVFINFWKCFRYGFSN